MCVSRRVSLKLAFAVPRLVVPRRPLLSKQRALTFLHVCSCYLLLHERAHDLVHVRVFVYGHQNEFPPGSK